MIEKGISIVTQSGEASDYFESRYYEDTKKIDAVSDVASPNATDLASAIILVNELKAQLNLLMSNLRSGEKMDE